MSNSKQDAMEEDIPFVKHDNFKEITLRGIILSALLSIVLGAANVYLGLFVGLTVSASIPASVISMSVLQCFKDSNILENNIVQTAASAGEALAAGIIFTIPGLIIMEKKAKAGEPGFENVHGWDTFLGGNYLYVTFLAIFGGFVGILFSIPIRRALILEIKPALRFPEGVATAQVLKAGQLGGKIVRAVVCGGLVGTATKLFETIKLFSVTSGFGWLYASKYPSYIGFNFASSLLAVGYIVGPQVGTALLLGALTQYMVTIPVSAYIHEDYAGPFTAEAAASTEWKRTRYAGVGLMVVGGIWALISVRSALYQAVKFGIQTFRSAAETTVGIESRYDRDIPFKFVLGGVASCLLGLYIIFGVFSNEWGLIIPLMFIIVILAFIFSAVAAYMAGLLGSSNNPISGVTICSALAMSAIILLVFGSDNPAGPPLTVVMCCAIACACAISGDNMQDLKCGHIVGATPWKQEFMMFIGVGAASFVVAPILEVLEKARGIGGDGPNSLAAPQATLISAIPVGIINGGLPWPFIGLGLGLGVAVIIIDLLLERSSINFRLPVLAFAVAFYLPIYYITPIFLGGMLHVVGRTDPDRHSSEGVLYAAGLVAGDALTGILTAIPIVITSNPEVLVPDAWKGSYAPPSWPAWISGFLVLTSILVVGKYEPFTRNLKVESGVISPADI